jgi:hypothetical protein
MHTIEDFINKAYYTNNDNKGAIYLAEWANMQKDAVWVKNVSSGIDQTVGVDYFLNHFKFHSLTL